MTGQQTRAMNVLLAAFLAAAVCWEAIASAAPPVRDRAEPRQTVLRVARSTDGLHFADTGDVLFVGASAPDLTVLANGDLLALFDIGEQTDRHRVSVPAAARSRDGGRTWSSVRRLRFRGGGRLLDVRRGVLVAVRGGQYRLFFASTVRGADRRRTTTAVRSAVTRDGIHFKVDRGLPLPLRRGEDLNPVAGWIGSSLHVFASEANPQASAGREGVHRAISRDGARFARLLPLPMRNATFVGCLLPIDLGTRAFVSAHDGMRVLESREGRRWRLRQDVTLPRGWDPAVVEVERGSYLMVYVAARSEDTRASSQLVAFDPVEEGWADYVAEEAWWDDATAAEGNWLDTGDASVESAEAADNAYAQDGDGADLAVASSLESDGLADPVLDGSLPMDTETVALAEDFGADGGSLDGFDPALTGGFAPIPDFVTKVHYLRWYETYAVREPFDNAYPHYAAFITLSDDRPGDKPEWPEFADMFNGLDHTGPPLPWRAEDYPQWAASGDAAADLFERYREATRHDGYAQPTQTANDPELDPAERDLLMGILLPSLGQHRKLAKALLADAWRAEDGHVSSERMLDAFETTLRNANHLHQGATLIEDLVGTAISNLTRDNARWALKQEVFAPDELETVLDTLQQYDVDSEDPLEAVRGEHAFSMDITQHMFTPPTDDGRPNFNRTRAERVLASWETPERTAELVERASQMTPDDVYGSLDAMDSHYRELGALMRIGYPEVRAADIAALEERSMHISPVTEAIMPALGRYYELRARSSANRRATQLAYAVEAFKTRFGRYPVSLSELPGDRGETMKIDPFTGDYFGYKLTADGPTIYSLSEDGLDGGGVHSPWWNDATGDGDSDDFVYWPPQHSP